MRQLRKILKTCCYLSLILNICPQIATSSSKFEQEDNVQRSTRFVIVPGQNGMGGNGIIYEQIINPAPGTQIFVKTPDLISDLGQSRCRKYLADTLTPLEHDEKVKNIIIHATSQGTATVLNYLAKNNLQTKVRAIILESVLVSGNSAIHHTVKSLVNSKITDLPGAYYWLPYLAKMNFPLYNPAGEQAIFSCRNLPRDIPIVIIHAAEDPQLPYDDTLALYYKLNQNFRLNVYLMSIAGRKHLNLLSQRSYLPQIKAINMIFKNHGLPYYDNMIDDKGIRLSGFQPNPDDYEQNYLDLMRREAKFKQINFILTKAFPLLLLAYMCTYFLS